jgi:hypothetical protein
MATATLNLLEKTSTCALHSYPRPARQPYSNCCCRPVPGSSRYHYQLRLVDARELGPDLIPCPPAW